MATLLEPFMYCCPLLVRLDAGPFCELVVFAVAAPLTLPAPRDALFLAMLVCRVIAAALAALGGDDVADVLLLLVAVAVVISLSLIMLLLEARLRVCPWP